MSFAHLLVFMREICEKKEVMKFNMLNLSNNIKN
jgi:hypothetical protein